MEVKILTNLHIIEGGIGKHLQFTALFNGLVKKEKRKLALMSGWPELFQNDDRVLSSQLHHTDPFKDTSHTLFQNYKNIIFNEPNKSNFLKGDKHIINYWASMYELENVDTLPDFKINKVREQAIKNEILKLNKFILVQFTGGQGVKQNMYDSNNGGRNYKHGQEVINLLKEEIPNLNIIVFGHDNEQEQLLNVTQSIFVDKLDFMILAKYCLSFLCIDSSLQHICSNKDFNKKGVVLWGTTKKNMYGYEKNCNLMTEHPYAIDIEPKIIVDNFLKLDLQ